MSKALVFIGIGLAVLVGGFFILNNTIYQEKQVQAEDLLPYENPTRGFSLRYPEGYIPMDPAEEGDLAVSFYLEEDREGSSNITVKVFENPETLSLVEWADSNDASNLHLGTGDFVEIEVQGKDGIAYGWSGLTDGLSVAVAEKDRVYLVSVTYLTLDDRIVNDFPLFLEFFELN